MTGQGLTLNAWRELAGLGSAEVFVNMATTADVTVTSTNPSCVKRLG